MNTNHLSVRLSEADTMNTNPLSISSQSGLNMDHICIKALYITYALSDSLKALHAAETRVLESENCPDETRACLLATYARARALYLENRANSQGSSILGQMLDIVG